MSSHGDPTMWGRKSPVLARLGDSSGSIPVVASDVEHAPDFLSRSASSTLSAVGDNVGDTATCSFTRQMLGGWIARPQTTV